MIGDPFIFTCLKYHNEGSITFNDNDKGKIIGKRIVSSKSSSIDNVALVKGHNDNLLSISQLCDVNTMDRCESSMYNIILDETNKVFILVAHDEE